MSGSWMLAFGGQNRGEQNSEMRRGARSEYEAESRSREAERFTPGVKRQIFDPDKFMPSSPVSPGTPQQPTRVMPANARGGSGTQNRMGFPVGEEYEAQMHGGEGSQAEGGELAHLHKYVKKLAQRLSHIEGGGEDFAKASGGNLMGKELFKKLPSLGRKALKVLKRPPETWMEYLEDEDFQAIYDMETKELEKAVKKAKESGEEASMDKEITHVCAALILLIMNDED